MPDHPRELLGYRGEQLVPRQFRHKGIGDVEQRAQTVPLSNSVLLGEEGLDGDGELAGDSLQERYLGRTGIDWRHGAEPERAEPVIAGSQRNEHQRTDTQLASDVVRTPASEFRIRDVRLRAAAGSAIPNRPDPGRRAVVSRVMTGFQGSFKDIPLHGVAVGIVENQPDMIKPDNSAKRFGYARQ